jgi:3-methyladenine DNA glycosylase AlkD
MMLRKFMTLKEILADLEANSTEQTKKTFLRHGAVEPLFGVLVGHLKKLQKTLNHHHELALQLFDTGNSDAMYLAALISEPQKMTKTQLTKWAKGATWHMISESAVAWTAAESRFAWELAKEWIDSKKPLIAGAGWATLSSYVGITPDEELDTSELEELMARVKRDIGAAPNRVKYTMNGFIICVGTYVAPLLKKAKAIAKELGEVEVDVGDTACQVPVALQYIEKIEKMGRVGKKRKTAFC